MTNPESYLSFHEIILTLLGEKGVNTLKGIPPKNVSLTPGGIGWFNDPTLPSRRKILYDNLEDDENRRNTQLRIIEVIENAIRNDEVKSPDKMGAQGIWSLEFRVEHNSLFSWFKSNPDKKFFIEALLLSLGRNFPDHWSDAIKVAGKRGRKFDSGPENTFFRQATSWNQVGFMVSTKGITIKVKEIDKLFTVQEFDKVIKEKRSREFLYKLFDIGGVFEEKNFKDPYKDNLKSYASYLRKSLKELFGISDNPIKSTGQSGYKTMFSIASKPLESGDH